MRPRARDWRVTVLIAACGLLVPAGGCRSDAQERREQLGASNPLDRAQAAVEVTEEADAGAVPRLVDLLEDANPAVRMYAILALERLTGTDRGFRYYGSEATRAAAVERWREALRRGETGKPDE